MNQLGQFVDVEHLTACPEEVWFPDTRLAFQQQLLNLYPVFTIEINLRLLTHPRKSHILRYTLYEIFNYHESLHFLT